MNTHLFWVVRLVGSEEPPYPKFVTPNGVEGVVVFGKPTNNYQQRRENVQLKQDKDVEVHMVELYSPLPLYLILKGIQRVRSSNGNR